MNFDSEFLPFLIGFAIVIAFVWYVVKTWIDEKPNYSQGTGDRTKDKPHLFPQHKVSGKRVRVVDGDGLEADINGFGNLHIRLAYVDAPEFDQPWGKESKDELWRLTDNDSIEFELIEYDDYNRVIAVVWSENKNINLEMVKRGHAWLIKSRVPESKLEEYISARKGAQDDALGLWQSDWPMSPWKWRWQFEPRKESSARNILKPAARHKLEKKKEQLEADLKQIKDILRQD